MAIASVPPRIFAILAREAKAAILFRRGPSRWCELILWHTNTDEIIRGQWVHRRIYEHNCDLSPDGQLLVYHAFDGRQKKTNSAGTAWTAVSRPPYFTALVAWNHHLPGGGGLFAGNRELQIFGAPVSIDPPLLPTTRTFLGDAFAERLKRSGWESMNPLPQPGSLPFRRWEKQLRRRPWTLIMKQTIGGVDGTPGHGLLREDFYIRRHANDEETLLTDADWADIDHKRRLVFTRKGKLYAAEVTPEDLVESMLADFTGDAPTPIPPPAWAKKWPT